MEILERGRPLPSSSLWTLQRSFYADQGADAFRSVPHYVTNMPFFARRLARVASVMLKEVSAPRIVELGSGSGRFGYLFMRALHELLDRPFVYHFTDFNLANLSFLRGHPRLEPWFRSGLAEVASLDVTSSRETPEADLYLANYLFGALPQDIVRLGENGLEQGLPVLRMLPANKPDEGPIERLLLPYELEYRPMPHDRLLEKHAREVGPNQPFLVPTTAREFIERIKTRKPFVMLISDKGVKTPQEWSLWPVPPLARHGSSISFPVDLPLLARLAGSPELPVLGERAGLRTLALAHRFETARLQEALQIPFDPNLVLKLLKTHEDRDLSVEERLRLLEATEHCPRVLSKLPPWPKLRPEEVPHLVRALENVETNYYPKPGDDFDLPGHLARLYHLAGDYSRAARWYQLRLGSGRPEPAIVANLALCLCQTGRTAKARELLSQIPDFEPAYELRKRLDCGPESP